MKKNDITAYMSRQGFGDYSKATEETRAEMEDAALEYAAQEQTAPSVFSTIGARAQMERYEAGTATAADLIALEGAESITAEQASAYRAARGWSPRKF